MKIDELLKKLEEAKKIKEKIKDMGGDNPDLFSIIIFTELSSLSNKMDSVSNKMSWLMGAISVAIGLLVAICVAIF